MISMGNIMSQTLSCTDVDVWINYSRGTAANLIGESNDQPQ